MLPFTIPSTSRSHVYFDVGIDVGFAQFRIVQQDLPRCRAATTASAQCKNHQSHAEFPLAGRIASQTKRMDCRSIWEVVCPN
jgi:hypothetical protein